MPADISLERLQLCERKATNQLEKFPPELLLNIIRRVSDLVSLDSLIQASPAMYRIFDNCAVEITEAVLWSGYTCPQIRVIICIVALIRESKAPIQDFVHFRARFTRASFRNDHESRRGECIPNHLAETTKATTIRSILATSRRLTWASLNCLKYHLDHFRALKLEHLVDEKFMFYRTHTSLAPQDKRYSLKVPVWSPKPEPKHFNVRDIGPPTWLEEQRVTRAFWRIQLYYDLRIAAASSKLAWPEEDIRRLNDSQPLDVYEPMTHLVQGDERIPHPEYQELVSVIDYLRETQCQDSVSHRYKAEQFWQDQIPKHYEVKREWPIHAAKGRKGESLFNAAPAIWFFFHYGTSIVGMDKSFQCFQYAGFAFWSSERMWACGLLVPDTQRKHNQYRFESVCHTWRTIFTCDEATRRG